MNSKVNFNLVTICFILCNLFRINSTTHLEEVLRVFKTCYVTLTIYSELEANIETNFEDPISIVGPNAQLRQETIRNPAYIFSKFGIREPCGVFLIVNPPVSINPHENVFTRKYSPLTLQIENEIHNLGGPSQWEWAKFPLNIIYVGVVSSPAVRSDMPGKLMALTYWQDQSRYLAISFEMTTDLSWEICVGVVMPEYSRVRVPAIFERIRFNCKGQEEPPPQYSEGRGYNFQVQFIQVPFSLNLNQLNLFEHIQNSYRLQTNLSHHGVKFQEDTETCLSRFDEVPLSYRVLLHGIIPWLAKRKYDRTSYCPETISPEVTRLPSTQLSKGHPVHTFPRQYFRKIELLVGEFYTEYGFLGCVPLTEDVNFSFGAYLKPFQWNLWIGVVLVSLLLSGIGLVLGKIYEIQDSPIILMLQILLEQSLSFSRKLSDSKAFSCVVTPISFVGIILVNAYKGLVITNMIMPPPVPELASFRDVITANYKFIPNDDVWHPFADNFGDWGLITDDVLLYRKNWILSDFCEKRFPLEILPANHSKVVKSFEYGPRRQNFTLKELCLDPYPTRSNISIDFLQNIVVPKNYPRNRPNSPDFSCENDFFRCEDKVMLYRIEELNRKLLKLKQKHNSSTHLHLYRSTDSPLVEEGSLRLKRSHYMIIFNDFLEYAYLRPNIQPMLSSGLVSYWEKKEIWTEKDTNFRNMAKFEKRESLEDSLVTFQKVRSIIIIFLVGIIVGILVFVKETGNVWLIALRRFSAACTRCLVDTCAGLRKLNVRRQRIRSKSTTQ